MVASIGPIDKRGRLQYRPTDPPVKTQVAGRRLRPSKGMSREILSADGSVRREQWG